MSRKPYIGPSDSQANAEALRWRDAPFTAASDASFRVKWDYHRREPRDLREAVSMVRRAYADEVPAKLHKGPDNAEGLYGAPGLTPQAEGYIFGGAQGSDRKDPSEMVSYYHAPFRAKLAELELAILPNGDPDVSCRKRAAIVSHVTIGAQGPQEAAIKEGVPSWCAKLVAEDALRAFLRGMTDLKLHVREAVA